ncbi:hypothetical protein F5ESL0236_08325 [Lactobacillus sp. ESL0236]|uniref:hypothetical protein n=1 Tax=unclassified Lactobacillus TaxID=2620435 RepID=UPI000EFD5131|nr:MULTISPECIES: hypothetical protein [unclassified Lactobacillus]RMC38149.1 hypothetical protein F5ESL0237_07580 [Lactobacillus sp. ESL0237]RMC42450.1 hypothetical protein F5ESL0234_08220 [Lactobacillus sp. ESL0234]RMC42616.1 hypothetical protein F5ESL0236_08325 [Lactobacillus sp. ESL0236]
MLPKNAVFSNELNDNIAGFGIFDELNDNIAGFGVVVEENEGDDSTRKSRENVAISNLESMHESVENSSKNTVGNSIKPSLNGFFIAVKPLHLFQSVAIHRFA